MLKLILSQHYKGKNITIYLDFDSWSQGNLTAIIEKIISSTNFKAFAKYNKITTFEISIISSNSSIDIGRGILKPLNDIYNSLGLVEPFVYINSNSSFSKCIVYIKDLPALRNIDKFIKIKDHVGENVIFDISKPNPDGSKFTDEQIKDFVNRNNPDSSPNVNIKTK